MHGTYDVSDDAEDDAHAVKGEDGLLLIKAVAQEAVMQMPLVRLGDAFAGIGVREPQPRASEAFRQFGDYHRQMEKYGLQMLKTVKPVSNVIKQNF